MKQILLLSFFFSICCIETLHSNNFSRNEISSSISSEHEKREPLFPKIYEKAVYLTTGTALKTASLLSRLGGELCLIAPKASSVRNECLLLSHLTAEAAHLSFAQAFNKDAAASSHLDKIPPSQHSWYLNQTLLSQIPAFSDEEKKLVCFLEKRWLAKSSGFSPSIVNWVCPCFGFSVQVHPETTSTYAREPCRHGIPQNYKNTVESWKLALPHPSSFPLILTRPFDVHEYLPACLEIPYDEKIENSVKKLALQKPSVEGFVVVDLTHIFEDVQKDRISWKQAWEAYKIPFSQACSEHHLELNKLVCVERVLEEHIGAIRILPLVVQSIDETYKQYEFLFTWISKFGLSANRVELDRSIFSSLPSPKKCDMLAITSELQSKEAFLSHLSSFEQNWKSTHPQKNLMIEGTLQVLRGLLANITDEKWYEITKCSSRSLVTQLSLSNIVEQFNALTQEGENTLFFETVSHVEQIHANLTALLEIFAPFTSADFPSIFQNALTSIPSSLMPLTSSGIHASGMTSLAGIFKAVEKSLGCQPHILYGENTYFENIFAAEHASIANSIEDATEKEWQECNLFLAQFNPVLKRDYSEINEYKVERVSEHLQKLLQAREGKPLTLALDCTLDFFDSPQVGKILLEFQEEIKNGHLNVVCYRSGLKFDLFGMDNYCGAPIYVIHNCDSKWDPFNSLSNDPVLQTDPLSLNWFCLAYQNAAPQLKLYQKQIFDNTRALLERVPIRLMSNKSTPYRIIPIEKQSDAGFIDIKISGPLHQIRGAALIAGAISMKCMENGHPIFYRQSMGFYHPNLCVLFSEKCTTIRLTLGLDPDQVDHLAECFEMIDNELSPEPNEVVISDEST